MKPAILELLQCPQCHGSFVADIEAEDATEIRSGKLRCDDGHSFTIEDGIIKFRTGFDHADVRKEILYEDSSYNRTDPRLCDRSFIAAGPESLVEVWPHIFAFRPGFVDMVQHMDIRAGQWVLDIGTASCWTTRLLAQLGANVIALDVNDADYYGLKASDIQFEAHDVYFERLLESMTDLPLADGSIDAVTCNASLHHTPDLDRSLKEFYRVLKPGGRFGASNEGLVSIRHRMTKFFNRVCFKAMEEEEGSHHDISYREFEDCARGAGFAYSYRAPEHLQSRIRNRLGGVGEKTVEFLGQSPLMLKQFKSTTVLLQKRPTGDRG